MRSYRDGKRIAFEVGTFAGRSDFAFMFIPTLVYSFFEREPYRYAFQIAWLQWTIAVKFYRNKSQLKYFNSLDYYGEE